jgi:hypothetical protein
VACDVFVYIYIYIYISLCSSVYYFVSFSVVNLIALKSKVFVNFSGVGIAND